MPVRAIADARLSALELRCLMAISIHDGMSLLRGTGQGCYARTSTLADLARTDITNFSKAISRLSKLGYITKEAQQSDKRRSTLRVVFESDDTWSTDQLSDGENVGEPTNNRGEIVGETTKLSTKVVGDAEARNGGNQPFPDPHYIPLNGELDSAEAGELNSVETAHRTFGATRDEGITDPSFSSRVEQKDPAEAGLINRELVSLYAHLPQRWSSLATAPQVIQFEAAFNRIGRDASKIVPSERLEFASWLTAVAEACTTDYTVFQAQRLLGEFELAA